MIWNDANARLRTPVSPSSPLARRRLGKAGALLLIAAVLVPALAGCFNGQRATTTVQATQDSNNGTQARLGGLRVENATLVSGPDGTSTATLIMSLFNDGREPDTLVGVTINGQPAILNGAAVTEGVVQLPIGAGITFGYQNSESWVNSYEITQAESAYVPVQLRFQRAGILDFSALTVPPVGIYEGIAPNPLTAPAP